MPTVQDTLTQAFRRAGLERNPVPSGRTDAGVHARMQVLSMRVVGGGEVADLAARINAELPPTVGVAQVKLAAPKFNAAWLAEGKVYRYVLSPAEDTRWSWGVRFDARELAAALERFVGTRDFGAFHDASSPRRLRTVQRIDCEAIGAQLVVRVRGDGFARYMVRQLVGAAVAVARGERSLEDLSAALEQPERADFHRFRAPAHGLVLEEVLYPAEVDPFSAEERKEAHGVPREPPFSL